VGRFGKKKKGAPGSSNAPKRFEDKHLSGAPQALGQDSANQVYKTTYKAKHAMSGGETSGYFKADAEMAPAKNAVGASRLADAMGWGHLIPETTFAKHDVTGLDGVKQKGVKGAVSKAAPGESLMSAVFDTPAPNYKGSGGDMFKRATDGSWNTLSGMEHSDVDLSQGHTQQQLNQLQWFDALIGNQDRHGGNIIVDPKTGNVTGIDNDLSFGDGVKARGWKDSTDDFLKGRDDKYLGLPQQLDETTAQTLLGLDRTTLKKVLNPKGAKKDQKFSKEELEETYERLALIQKAVAEQQKAGTLLKGWDDTTYQAALAQKWDGGRSQEGANYAQRQHNHLTAANNASNDVDWVRGKRQQTAPGSLPNQPQPTPVTAPTPAPVPAPTSAWTSGSPSRSSSTGPTLGASRRQAPAPPPQSAKPNHTIPRPAPPARPPAPTVPVGVGASGPQTTRPPVPPQSTKPQLTRRPTPKVLKNSPWKGL
jgi:hypothetical protein